MADGGFADMSASSTRGDHATESAAHTDGSAAGKDSVIVFQFFAMVIIFCIKVGFGSAPLYFRTNLRFLSIANAFAAGVFLAGGLVHLLPEAVEAFMKLEKAHGHHDHDHEHGHGHGHHEHADVPVTPFALCAVGFLLTFYLEKVLLAKDAPGAPAAKAHTHSPQEERLPAPGSSPSPHAHTHAGDADVILHFANTAEQERSIMPVILTAVLSIHSVVSGMALGIQDSYEKAFLIFLAIVSHKWVEAFSLGTSIVKATDANIPVMVRLLSAFAVSSPIGILIGSVLQASLSGAKASVATAVLDSAASGTFIYIAVVDTLVEEFSNGIDKNRKFIAVIAGFAMMRFLSTLVQHHH
eukprot:Rhum_TRINITY_DN16550_c0_g1::Rhum_TRINITY_DN16550_c0_g1_i1::g.163622::m.163622/K14709/SLC39A1_2_3, ZIP1_2_3; solute carrier family 39 (zinc transporter), member 1/2/3